MDHLLLLPSVGCPFTDHQLWNTLVPVVAIKRPIEAYANEPGGGPYKAQTKPNAREKVEHFFVTLNGALGAETFGWLPSRLAESTKRPPCPTWKSLTVPAGKWLSRCPTFDRNRTRSWCPLPLRQRVVRVLFVGCSFWCLAPDRRRPSPAHLSGLTHLLHLAV